jgi:hypothetical protein
VQARHAVTGRTLIAVRREGPVMSRLGQSVVLVTLVVSQDLHVLDVSFEWQSRSFELHSALGPALLQSNLLPGVEWHGIFSLTVDY